MDDDLLTLADCEAEQQFRRQWQQEQDDADQLGQEAAA
jgi:hypothetical protein